MSAQTIEVGKTYTITHCRRGEFVARVVEVDDTWVIVVIVEGSAVGMRKDWQEGEKLTCRREFCTFTEKGGAA